MKQRRPADEPDSSNAAYARALRWLTARELSEAQVRARLTEAGYRPPAISAAIERLLANRTIDDRRAASAVARSEARVRRHGPHRVMAKLLAMKIDRETAKDVIRELFGEDEDGAFIDVALDRRLRGRVEKLSNPDERQKIVAYLVRQGFSASDALGAIRRKTANPDG